MYRLDGSSGRFLFIIDNGSLANSSKKWPIPLILSLVLLLISNLTNGLRFHQFLVTKSEEAKKSVKTDANGAH